MPKRTTELNDCIFVLFCLASEMLGIWRHVIHQWKGLENIFPTVYYTPQVLELQSQNRKL